MRILLIDVPGATDVAQMKSFLSSSGHHVDLISSTDPGAIRRALTNEWNVVIMEWLSSPPPVEVLRTLGSLEDGPVCIVCSAKATPANIDAAFKAGAEDFLRKPIPFELLRGRLARIVAHQEEIRAASARGGSEAQAAASTLLDLRAWHDFPQLAATAAAGVTMVPLSVCRAPSSIEPFQGSMMLLTVASAHIECRVIVDGDRVSMEKLTIAAVGTHDAAAAADVLNEIANTVGGALMRAACDEDVAVTIGLPRSMGAREMGSALEETTHSQVCWMTDADSGAHLRVRAGVRVRKNRFVKVMALREGMVLARDLTNIEGAMLLTAGTRVTSSASERLRQILDARCMVEVADTAA